MYVGLEQKSIWHGLAAFGCLIFDLVRVTRLGEFSSVEQMFTSGDFLPKILDIFNAPVHFDKMGC
jgi:hypothetical protein